VQRPPAHQTTERAKPAETADARAEGTEPPKKPRPHEPPTAKTARREGDTPEETAEDRASESTPDAQPTARPRPDRRTEPTTAATSGAHEDATDREPTTPTKGTGEEATIHPQGKSQKTRPEHPTTTPREARTVPTSTAGNAGGARGGEKEGGQTDTKK